MTEPEEMYLSVVNWCFDSSHRPVCPSLWDEREECDRSDCPYSHEVEGAYQHGTCALPLHLLDESANIQDLAEYLAQHSMFEGTEPAATVIEKTQSELDEEEVRRMLEEMKKFEEEKGKEEEEKLRAYTQKLCPYFAETGNCLRRAECPYSHDSSEEAFIEDVHGRWYPSGKDCECCRGYIYKCEKEGCQKLGVCAACQAQQ